MNTYSKKTLYDQKHEHDSCGTGFVAHVQNQASHKIVELAIQAVTNLTHRGAVSADMKTGDGAGIMTQIPQAFFSREIKNLGCSLNKIEDLGLGMIFLPHASAMRDRCRAIIEDQALKNNVHVLAWREVPINVDSLGDQARQSMPVIEQVLLGRSEKISPREFERVLYLVRKSAEKQVLEESIHDFYISSLSSKVIIYKGLLVAHQLKEFYLDLADPLYESSFALFHQRFSTNTFPTWALAQPFRMIAHNGEINTIQGNRNWMRAREPELDQLAWVSDPSRLKPVIMDGASDSASLDNALESLVRGGRDILQVKSMMLPEAWEKMPYMSKERRAYFEYHSCLMEPWDGPAAITFSDGKYVGAILDRNGLRPARYVLTEDGMMVLGSEAGMIPIDEEKVIKKGRLGPGQMIAIDLEEKRILENEEIKSQLTQGKPYVHWIEKNLWRFSSRERAEEMEATSFDAERQHRLALAMGYTKEEIDMVLKPMAVDAKEPTYSMGNDAPLAVLSQYPKPLYDYFKQLFAQVTNPPIDPIRENLVMALTTYLGPSGNIFEDSPEHAKMIQLTSPILDEIDLEDLRKNSDPHFKCETLKSCFRAKEGPKEMEEALLSLCASAAQAVREGTHILILSDREIDSAHARIPMLLAVAAVHHHLIREGLRMRVGLIADTGNARDVHHIACLIGYGAQAVCPYLAMSFIANMTQNDQLNGLEPAQALANYKKAVESGLYKIMSKMGISTLSSYKGAQIFEVIGFKQSVIQRYFTGTFSKAGGIGLEEFAEDILKWHEEAFKGEGENIIPLHIGGNFRYRREGEYHAFNPDVTKNLIQAAKTGSEKDYQSFAKLVNERPATTLRDLLGFKKAKAISIDEVESVEDILKRFNTASISLGALSKEAHMTIAIAMNRLGGKSGSGEGGEDSARFFPMENGDSANSKIKQIASGRFGVRASYLAYAEELEIKMAQGSKPGEGGQLPGKKVSEEIARLRHSTPGVTLISPPPHHDIYSIEDLAQLIYDLKAVNPKARVIVKLVAESGVGTIAAGVAKAHADVILISGHDGGTGASPLSSIKNAGSAWELGLSETQQTLVKNDLRGRVILRADGGLKTGMDVVKAAILGAEEFGFGTAVMIAASCCMIRQCHMNTCPTGVATQDPRLRAKFKGTPEMVVNYLMGVAQEVREILASMGKTSLQEIIGCPELLEPVFPQDRPRSSMLEMDRILYQVDSSGQKARVWGLKKNDWHEKPLNHKILQEAEPALAGEGSVTLHYSIHNTDRSLGASVAGEIGKRYVDEGLPPGSEVNLHFKGSAGQSFGVWMTQGMHLHLEGEANDYVGKGMSGGEMTIMPSPQAKFIAEENVIIGNTCFYGATGGTAFIRGKAGERFCVRNSGGVAIVEGVGDHACEYMTGGMTVILGPTGRNFGAGMTGGEAYVLDEKRSFEERCNMELIKLEPVKDTNHLQKLAELLKRHRQLTGSKVAEKILENFAEYQKLFWRVSPKEEVVLAAKVIPLKASKNV
ncbi:MAG: glutamate synthase large subunit [Deltaproteobacteria bacterium]|nr:glutamate synthase large subunit [Deltaproteobacteria bacterium]